MLNKNVSLNDFFYSLQHALHPVHIIKTDLAAQYNNVRATRRIPRVCNTLSIP